MRTVSGRDCIHGQSSEDKLTVPLEYVVTDLEIVPPSHVFLQRDAQAELNRQAYSKRLPIADI